MKDSDKLQTFVNNFRRHLASYLKPGVGLVCNIYPTNSTGAILEFTIGPQIANEDHFKPVEPSVNDALGKIKQRAFGGNLAGFRFSGTNVVMEDNRIILIKGEENDEAWDDKAALEDVKRLVVRPSSGGRT
jgi:hypothetical protein